MQYPLRFVHFFRLRSEWRGKIKDIEGELRFPRPPSQQDALLPVSSYAGSKKGRSFVGGWQPSSEFNNQCTLTPSFLGRQRHEHLRHAPPNIMASGKNTGISSGPIFFLDKIDHIGNWSHISVKESIWNQKRNDHIRYSRTPPYVFTWIGQKVGPRLRESRGGTVHAT